MKPREIVTQPISLELFWDEFRYCIDYFLAAGHTHADVLFGYEWGIHYYSTAQWQAETFELSQLEQKIRALEALATRDNQLFGRNDVFIEVDDLTWQFCHHTDVHLGFNNAIPVVEHFYARWKELGFEPAEWLTSDDPKVPPTWVRGRKPRS